MPVKRKASKRTPQERHTTAAKKRAFLGAFRKVVSITRAAQIAGIDRDVHYDWKKNDPEYAAEFEECQAVAWTVLEDEAIRRASEGVQKPVYQGGKRVGYVQEYSDTLLIFLMKGAMPDKYRERFVTEHTGPKGTPLFSFAEWSAEHLAELADRLRSARGGAGTTTPGGTKD